MSRWKVRISVAVVFAPLWVMTSLTDAHALLPAGDAFTIIGQEVSSTPGACPAGSTLDSFAGWKGSAPDAGSPLGFTLDLCRGNLPTSGSIPVYGYYNTMTPSFPVVPIQGSITFLREDIAGGANGVACTFVFALYFFGDVRPLFVATTTPETVGAIITAPAGALQLDYLAGGIVATACNLGTARGSVGGQMAQELAA